MGQANVRYSIPFTWFIKPEEWIELDIVMKNLSALYCCFVVVPSFGSADLSQSVSNIPHGQGRPPKFIGIFTTGLMAASHTDIHKRFSVRR